jgi:uncharacterized membrane protein
MHNFLLSFLSAAIIMGIIDAVWLSVVASTFYKSQIGNLLLAKPRMVPAVVLRYLYNRYYGICRNSCVGSTLIRIRGNVRCSIWFCSICDL